jgi:hypothetical protein
MSAVLPPKPRLGPAPPPRPPGPLAPDAAWDHLQACLAHFAQVVKWGEDYAVGVAIEAIYHALRGVHKAENPRAFGGDPNYI